MHVRMLMCVHFTCTICYWDDLKKPVLGAFLSDPCFLDSSFSFVSFAFLSLVFLGNDLWLRDDTLRRVFLATLASSTRLWCVYMCFIVIMRRIRTYILKIHFWLSIEGIWLTFTLLSLYYLFIPLFRTFIIKWALIDHLPMNTALLMINGSYWPFSL